MWKTEGENRRAQIRGTIARNFVVRLAMCPTNGQSLRDDRTEFLRNHGLHRHWAQTRTHNIGEQKSEKTVIILLTTDHK